MYTYTLKSSEMLLDGQATPFHTKAKKVVYKIKDMPSEDKPREKMEKYGPAALSSAELLAVVFGVGTTKEDALEMSARILKEYGEKAIVSHKNVAEMSVRLDIPVGKAAQIVACGELGRRFYERSGSSIATIRTPKDVYEHVMDMRGLPKEHLRGLYLNTHHRVVHDEVISIGTIDANLIHPREVFKPAIEYGASAIVLVHNHPSGIVTPSQADIEITKQLIEVGKLVGIQLVDHVIVTKDTFSSIGLDY